MTAAAGRPDGGAGRRRGEAPAGPLTVPELLARRAAAEPGKVALVVEGHGSMTLAEWDGRSDAAATALAGRGVRPGDRVGLLFEPREWIEFAVAYCAVQKAGAVAVPLSDRLAPPALRGMAGHCSAAALVHGTGAPKVLAAEAPDGVTVIAAGEIDGPGGSGGPLPEVQVRPGDLAQILYTSGTTGTPKGVAATHANLTFGCVPERRMRPFAHSRHLLHAFPIGTNAGQMMLITALDAKPAVLTLPAFTPARFGKLIERHRAGTVFLVPAMARELLSSGIALRHDMSSVLLLGSAAAPLPPAVAAELAQAFPNAMITNYYTSTEAAPAQTIMVFDPGRPGALGRPAAGCAIRVAGEDGEPLPPGRTGEVWLRSPAQQRVYYGDRQASDETFRAGWVRMGDLGYVDEDGYLYLVDRESDVIKSGAFKVSTLQVEAAMYEHPAVAEAAAFGVPHPALGKAVAAAVVLREPVTSAELRGFLAARLARHEIPARFAFLDALPRNTGGKVLKRELAAGMTIQPDAGTGDGAPAGTADGSAVGAGAGTAVGPATAPAVGPVGTAVGTADGALPGPRTQGDG
ncbi:class I adenylate-forming enzyme family protein [Microbispora sp. NPDC049125]|uniref:class I adenylate-forming enzyme family protein n=1 Tax=Microbispora sp. NPDC049125 TaxID=3154929 RepID=UPI00346760E2